MSSGDPEPFFKWDPDGVRARERQDVRRILRGGHATKPERPRDRLAGKRFLLRWAWAISTGVLLVGYVIMALVLSGRGDALGL